MASVQHCIYCFESLVAHLEKRKSMTLDDVGKSWSEWLEYCQTSDLESDAADGKEAQSITKRLPALRRLADSTDTSSSSFSSSASGSSISLATETPATSTTSLADAPALVAESPLFVTWNIVSPRTGDTSLRGCIGTFDAQELDQGLADYAVISAIQDSRFRPISERELPSLEVAVTLLTDFEDCDDAMDWELGIHGIRISFTDRSRRYGSTYLPDVAPEQGWTKEETLVSLMRKAGWVGRKDKWQDIDLKVVRYQGKKEKLHYSEFKRWRDWVDRREGEA
ncbi:AMMECR1 domain-containing protein [Xylariaceae sp. FL0662B]|nr:AMMECR1 domain-containing protein [Xylariaceae sp. FL0662B]